MKLSTYFLSILLLLTFGSQAHAEWLLDGENSHLSFGSVKKNTIGESNHFATIDSRISDGGEISLTVDLASVETWVDIRNERIRKFLFQTGMYPVATLSGQIDLGQFQDMEIGASQLLETSLVLELHGQRKNVECELVVTRLGDNRVMVVPHELIFLDAEDFDLLSGLQKLQELAGLPSISTAVPLSFYLTYTKE
ncbi:YceI family protein [Emcibacter nanhaiensis]|uniref:YceI family protein n=1 Tax=Emcibacter nanhaiensis TaxID=1505037 RepID=A0A501PGM1_9PROT|nr:YceI family protein [Emcibacter nanhaiensis]TPD59228.1 YceI family protein [Emcibacter nanhaiensis]